MATAHTMYSRRGSVLKKMLIVFAAIFTLVVLVVGAELFQALTAHPTITENYSKRVHDRMLERQRAIFGDGPNEYPRLEAPMTEAYAAYEWVRSQDAERQYDRDDPWPDPGFDMLLGNAKEGNLEYNDGLAEYYEDARTRAIAALYHWRDAGLFDRAAEIAKMERVAVPPSDGPVLEMLLPYLGAARRLNLAQAARLRMAAEAGDDAQAITAFEESLAMSRLTANQGYLICWLVGISMHDLAYEQLTAAIMLHPPTDERWLIAADAAIEREAGDRFPKLADVLENERLATADIVQRSYTKGGRFIPLAHARLIHYGELSSAAQRMVAFGNTRLSNITGRLYIDRDATDAWLDRALELDLAAANATGPDAIAAEREAKAFAQTATARNPIGGIGHDISNSLRSDRARRIRASGTRVQLAIERYRLRHGGAIPQTLDELGQLLPESLRTDPVMLAPWVYEPTPVTIDWQGTPLGQFQRPWPYTLRSAAFPGFEGQVPPIEDHPSYGLLITRPVSVFESTSDGG